MTGDGRPSAIADRHPPAIIVAGGAARRLGGGLKTLQSVGSQTILARLVARLTPQCCRLVLNVNGDASPFAEMGLTVVADHPEDVGCGPLAGVLAGLDHIAQDDPAATLALTTPSDTPFLPLDLVARLRAGLDQEGAVVAAARSGDRTHPLVALWPVALRDELRALLRVGHERRVGAALGRWPVAWVTWPAEPLDPFFNINVPADLETAALLAATGLP